MEAGAPVASPVGRVHLGRDVPEDWAEQATAETIIVKMINGFPDRRWTPMAGRQNHYLDCRIYAMAAAAKLMLDTLTEVDWARLRAERYAPADPDQGDLLAMPMAQAATPKAPETGVTSEEDDRPAGWIAPQKDWF